MALVQPQIQISHGTAMPQADYRSTCPCFRLLAGHRTLLHFQATFCFKDPRVPSTLVLSQLITYLGYLDYLGLVYYVFLACRVRYQVPVVVYPVEISFVEWKSSNQVQNEWKGNVDVNYSWHRLIVREKSMTLLGHFVIWLSTMSDYEPSIPLWQFRQSSRSLETLFGRRK